MQPKPLDPIDQLVLQLLETVSEQHDVLVACAEAGSEPARRHFRLAPKPRRSHAPLSLANANTSPKGRS
jgi:hypothetical protein